MPSAPAKATHRLHHTPSLHFHGLCHSSASSSHAILPLRINAHRTHTPPRPSFKGRLPRKTSIGRKRRKRTKRNTGKGTDIAVSHVRSMFSVRETHGERGWRKAATKADRREKDRRPSTCAHALHTPHTHCMHAHCTRFTHSHARRPPTSSRTRTKKTGSEPDTVPTL